MTASWDGSHLARIPRGKNFLVYEGDLCDVPRGKFSDALSLPKVEYHGCCLLCVCVLCDRKAFAIRMPQV